MRLDLEDVLAGTFGRIILLFLFLAGAVWAGGVIGGLACFVGEWDFSPWDLFHLPRLLWQGPLFLINVWIVPNAALLAATVVILLVTDSMGFAAWGIIVGFESLFVMLGRGFDLPVRETLVAWLAWLVILAMVETGVWLTRQMRMNRWARDLAVLNAENAVRRAEREALARNPDQADSPEDAGLN